MLNPIDRARTDPVLIEMTDRTKEHFNAIISSMHNRQLMWGADMDIVNPDTISYSATVRRSLAFEKTMHEMPVEVEPYALLAGLNMTNGLIVRCMLPNFMKDEEFGECTINMSHKCPDYETLLDTGLSGILNKLAIQKEKLLQKNPIDPQKEKKLDFCQAVERELKAVMHLSNRYAQLALQRAEENKDNAPRLTELARICRKVPEFPAESFHEAIQSMWFLNHVLRETQTNISIGHIDHILYPYFQKDFNAGKITLEKAQELVDEFDLRVNDRAQIDPSKYVVKQEDIKGAPAKYKIYYGHGFVESAENDSADAINHWGQNILLSGLRADGTDDTNILTYLFLNAHEKFQMTSPVLTVRMHKKSPPELHERVAEVLKTGGGMPYINNDDVIVSAYENLGVLRQDACDYANSNCWETLIQGRSNQEMIRFINFLYLLELALNRGKSVVYAENRRPRPHRKGDIVYGASAGPGNPVVDGIDTGDVSSFESIDDIMIAWKKQLDYMLEESMDHISNILDTSGSHGKHSSIPVLSGLTRDCIEKLTDITHHGARYDLWHMMGEAVSNAADAMSSLQTFVFEQKLVTLPQLVQIMKNNWEGNEDLRQKFLKEAPRFGNGLKQPDMLAKEMVDYFIEKVGYFAAKHKPYIFSPCIGTFSWIISIGKNIGASADGRLSKDPIAANMSPVPGSDVSGPTAAIYSYLQLNTKPMAAGAPIDLRLNKNGLEGAEGTNRISALIKTFIEAGGNMLTLTITNAEELKAAMEDPEKYRGLRVRMGGWSAYFVLLSKEAQKIHLKRVEHGII